MGLSQESDSSASVLHDALELEGGVSADKKASGLANPLRGARLTLKRDARAREDREEEQTLALRALVAREGDVDRSLKAYGPKVVGLTVTAELPGNESALYLRLFAGGPAEKLLPKDEAARPAVVEQLVARIQDQQTPAPVRKDAKELLDAVDEEKAARAVLVTASTAAEKGKAAELQSKLACIAAQRACTGQVHALYPSDPARVRIILGHATPAHPKHQKKEAPKETPKEEPKPQTAPGAQTKAATPANPPAEAKPESPPNVSPATTPIIAAKPDPAPTTTATATAGSAAAPITVTLTTALPPPPPK